MQKNEAILTYVFRLLFEVMSRIIQFWVTDCHLGPLY